MTTRNDNYITPCPKVFHKRHIKFYELMFIIFSALFANYFVAQSAFELWWWIGQPSLFLAALMYFRIYAKLSDIWEDMLRTFPEDPITNYLTCFGNDDDQYLKIRLYCSIVFIGEFICSLVLKRYFMGNP